MVLSLIVHFEAKEGQEEALEKALRALVEQTVKESGCIDYKLYKDLEHPAKFAFYENWASQAEWEAHMQMPHIKAFQQNMDSWVAHFSLQTLEKLC